MHVLGCLCVYEYTPVCICVSLSVCLLYTHLCVSVWPLLSMCIPPLCEFICHVTCVCLCAGLLCCLGVCVDVCKRTYALCSEILLVRLAVEEIGHCFS